MHLVLVISSLNPGGSERVLSELANYWIVAGKRISLVTFAPPDSKPFYRLEPKINLIQLDQTKAETFFYKRLFNIFKRIFCLHKTLKDLKPDLIISFIGITNVTTLLANLGLITPVIVSERIDPKYHHIPVLYQKIRKFIYKEARYVVVQTKSAACYFKNLNNICIIPNAVPKPTLSKQLNFSSIQHIISVGRLNPQKSFDTLIYAFAAITKSYPNLKLTIYGEGEERTNLKLLIESLNLQNNVFLPGITKNIQEALLNADLFIFPSQYEGFPNALCEAMACGLPVIASNCSGNIDIIRDRIDGRLFPVGDIATLTNITFELIKDFDQRQRLSENAKTICERFDPNRIYALWDKLIDSCTTKISP